MCDHVREQKREDTLKCDALKVKVLKNNEYMWQ